MADDDFAPRDTTLIDLVRSLQAQHKHMTADELDACAVLLNVRASAIEGSQDPTIWDAANATSLPVVPFRQHYDYRTGLMVVTLIDPEDFYAG